MINVQILGTEQVQKELLRRGDLLERNVQTWTEAALIRLQGIVKERKLKGGTPLHQRSGKLSGSIHYDVRRKMDSIVGRLYSNMGRRSYAGIHEYGAVFDRPITMVFGRRLDNPIMTTFHYPERSYLRSTLSEEKNSIARAMRRAVSDTLAGKKS